MSSELKVDNISEKTTNAGVQMGSALGLLSKTTTQMNAMSGMAAGDIIYNSTVGTIYVYNGSSWNAMSDNTFQFSVSWLVIAGGGAGGGSTIGVVAKGICPTGIKVEVAANSLPNGLRFSCCAILL